ncbi:MAG TPA: hypothetical protein VM012_06970 [Flavitalea sp.]|nr:hypothetical protein [Flavitalea sp.]
MVTTEVSQLSGECNTWRNSLRTRRESIQTLRKQLQEVAGRQTNKEILQEIEHLHNQFHIQLINIHDLKQLIKTHDRRISLEKAPSNGNISEPVLAEHEELFDQYESLEHTLEDLQDEFRHFMQRAN